MKVFLSWSGERSKQVANLLSSWLCCVIQATRPWISSKDIDRGSLWFSEINDQLKDTSVGIICLTQENKNRPWILFEAGALAKGLSTSRVCTLLIDLESTDIEDPLAQFNHTFPVKDNMLELVKTLNSSLGNNSLDYRVLEQVFETYWPQFENEFQRIKEDTKSQDKAQSKPRPQADMLTEILENTRTLGQRMRGLEREVDIIKTREREINPFPMRLLESRVLDMAKQGVPPDQIVDYFSDRAPRTVIRRILRDMKNTSSTPNLEDL
ncbi:TIR domain-containing protein [Neisseria animaloris]|uniref:TIR domain-containing protein n=1 Tax=Neisseria animaloris TaxID=326522 RepID=A0A3S4YH13_9NEIS|nr:TIR domain-containing protein [Neisseria animaloris]VEJ21025.1 Uncharacterised protein [Neisseria animaloris]